VGQTYPGGTGYHKRTVVRKGVKRESYPPLISLHIPKGFDVTKRLALTERPKIDGSLRSRLGWECFTNEEQLVALIAQHFRYMWQYEVPKGWRVWGSRGKYSQRDAYAYAIKMTRAWRRRSTEPESKIVAWKKKQAAEAEARLQRIKEAELAIRIRLEAEEQVRREDAARGQPELVRRFKF